MVFLSNGMDRCRKDVIPHLKYYRSYVKGLLKLEKKSSYLHDKQFLVYAETDGGHSFSYYVGTDL